MTASGICHVCNEVATSFHYRRPLKEAGFHDGFWHCPNHGPEQPGTVSVDEKQIEGPRLSRAERRAMMKKPKRRF